MFFNGEKLIKAIDDDSQGHYYEVGTEDMSSNTIKLTSDWYANVGDVFEFSIRTNGEGKAEEVVVDSIPIGTVIDYEGDTVPEGYEEVEDKGEVYSTEEVRIGTWIDGKPLYRKVFAGTKESEKNKTINISDLNVDYIRYYGNITTNIGQSDGEYEFPLNYYETSSAYIRTNFHRKYSNITIVSTNGTYFNGNFKLVIEYTKTTD